jgi:hypothetical protein
MQRGEKSHFSTPVLPFSQEGEEASTVFFVTTVQFLPFLSAFAGLYS